MAGDDCLRHVARVLAAHLRRSGDRVAHYGGEEFVLLAPVRDAADALHIAETAHQALYQAKARGRNQTVQGAA